MANSVQTPEPIGHALRQAGFFALVILSTLIALGLLVSVFHTDGLSPIELLLLLLYAILFSWICISFWSALMGFFILLFGRDRWAISRQPGTSPDPTAPPPRTAILMPIYNEDSQRVFAGLRATHQSLVDTGQSDGFDFFILSDTRDPDVWVEEELRWQDMVRALDGKGRIFYRNRPENTSRKTGNLEDFCTRWGGHYRYMIVLDADSIMKGSTLVEMVRLMENHPGVALIQTPPVPVNRESLFARILQFAGGIYGRMFTAGLNYWQLGESNYWGHNAIIRIQPFLDHCGLPKLSGREPFGGEILSHDFVEAALLRRAGWEVWLAYDLDGSYEEIPPTLIDYAKRDRRWCQGNMQHLRLAVSRGLNGISRLHFIMGVMSYAASPLWLLFLVATGVDAYLQTQQELVYFFGQNWMPVWPVSFAVEMTTVLLVTLTMLFLPKLLALLLLLKDAKLLRAYGGLAAATWSVILETVFSVLTAPVLMLFQTKFVLAILMRRAVGWPPQQRGDHMTSFKEAALAHGGHTLIGIVTGVLSYWYVPAFFWWFTPVLVGLILSIPVSMLSSSIALGRQARELGLFLTPEETEPPAVLRYLAENLEDDEPVLPVLRDQPRSRFVQALTDPYVNALHLSLLPEREPPGKRRRHYLEGLIHHLEEEGPDSMSAAQKRDLIADPESLQRLHALFWSRPPADAGALP
ncbi:Glycosyl transferase, group 2 family protein [Candidatus Competibacter denitrificans Run_A_D11]|uniref:Glucans biosynthesis glucosyltransferase H n=1 Tax=Candidatus Competibacter denitrificans Run_A_D11 TaxID=1400863 RepID=W6MCT4_9GAMM|nr:glucans biosynthesis glucosyltransferase MdoH [Candidatus Competibacter denitrificans]CDI02208.1 Glycosyl transferase, group 2 family protein [Candidatus Competibacter denitrificans Run_A_D11]HAS87528.1 glucans biosynthesis glucosyltransferase MdoH [Candidatus Competibacteraceae bacterium]HRC68477.1 glucans biosynthesis glucosyltransferase MdoH [Candidatus Competibacter denitrificans]